MVPILLENKLEEEFSQIDAFVMTKGELGGKWYQLKNNRPYVLTIQAVKIPSLGELEQHSAVKDLVITKEDLESNVTTLSPYSSIPIGL